MRPTAQLRERRPPLGQRRGVNARRRFSDLRRLKGLNWDFHSELPWARRVTPPKAACFSYLAVSISSLLLQSTAYREVDVEYRNRSF